MTTSVPVTIYSESTPNPEAMKFVANMMLLRSGVKEYPDVDSASDSPLSQQLFRFGGVKSIFITSNFITVTKHKDTDWFDIVNLIREFIRGYISSGDPVFSSEVSEIEKANTDHVSPTTSEGHDEVLPEGELEQKIVIALDEYVKPAVEQDGGAIHFKSFDNGIVTVILKGSCSGCPSSTVTLKSGIENLLTKMIPEVKEVVAESD